MKQTQIAKVIPIRQPKPVGRYQIADSFAVEMWKKPSLFHRIMMRVWFGWKWCDYELSVIYTTGSHDEKRNH